MGTHFVGSDDHVLCTDQSVVSGPIWVGDWFDVNEAEIYELEATVSNLAGGATLVVYVDGFTGISGGSETYKNLATLTFTENGTQKAQIPVGSEPCARRVGAWAENDGAAGTLNATLKEGRSGLLNQ